MWSEYLLQTLDLWFQHYMTWMMTFQEGYGLILPLLMLKERNQLEDRDHRWALLLLLVRGLPGVISQFHSLLGLTFLIHLISIGHEHLLNRMIRLTHLSHQYSRVMQYRAQRGLQSYILLQYNHAMQHMPQRDPQLYTLDLELHKSITRLTKRNH